MVSQLEIYFNTTRLEGNELVKERKRADKMNGEILALLIRESHRDFTPWEVLDWYEKNGRSPLITNIRRALTSLTIEGFFIKGDKSEQRKGRVKSMNYTWRINPEKIEQAKKLLLET